jgi:hypothetical protein
MEKKPNFHCGEKTSCKSADHLEFLEIAFDLFRML